MTKDIRVSAKKRLSRDMNRVVCPAIPASIFVRIVLCVQRNSGSHPVMDDAISRKQYRAQNK